MASSLSQQLSQVRSYNAAQLGNAKIASKVQSASYLFSADVASTQDFYTLQSLGANGWEELSSIDNTFSRWDQATGAGEMLFGDSSRALDRLMKDKKENEELDVAIHQFLQLVGGNLLDRSTGKCIEWLVRRFKVHEYNVEDVLSTFLPYHETQEFARMLQLLDLKDKPHFAFLLPIQKRAVPLTSSVLISTLLGPPSSTSSLSTLRWIVGMLSPKTIARFRLPNYALQTFWFSTIIKFCSRLQGQGDDTFQMGIVKGKARSRHDREDDYQQYLTVLLPTSVDAATSTQLGLDCQIGGCLVLCSIATCFQLSTAARTSVIASLADAKMDVERVRKAYLTACACLCMGQIEQHSNALPLIDGATSQKIASKSSIAATIRALSQNYDISAFVEQLASSLCLRVHDINVIDRSTVLKLLEELLQDSLVTPDSVAERIIGDCLILCSKENGNAEMHGSLSMLASLRQRRPEVMDKAVSKQTSDSNRDDIWKVLKRIMAIQAGSALQTDGEAGNDSQTSAWLHLHDPASSSRVIAFRALIKQLEQKTVAADDRFVKQALLAILSDDSKEVLESFYGSSNIVLQSLSLDDIVAGITSALQASKIASKNGSSQIDEMHLRFLLTEVLPSEKCSESLSWQVYRTILWPRLLTTKGDKDGKKGMWSTLENIAASTTSSSPVLERLRAMTNARKSTVNAGKWPQVNAEMARILAMEMSQEKDEAFFLSDIEFLLEEAEEVEDTNSRSCLLASLVLYHLLPLLQAERYIFTASRIAQVLEGRTDSWPLSGPLTADELEEAIYSKPNSSKTKATALAHLLKQMAAQTTKAEGDAVIASYQGSPNIAALTYKLAIASSFASPKVSSEILTTIFSKLGNASLTFLASIWTTVQHDEEVRLAALRHARAFLVAFTAKDEKVRHVDFQTILPSLLFALRDVESAIRLEALECVGIISQISNAIEEIEKKDSALELYGYDSIYGDSQSEHLKYLDTADVLQLTKSISKEQASFEHDALYLHTWMQTNLSITKGEAKRDVSFKRRILEVLLSHILCWSNYEAKLNLLDTLDGVQDTSRLHILLPLINDIVKGDMPSSLDNDQIDAYTELLMSSYDKTARNAIEADEGRCWSIYLEGLREGSPVVQKHAANTLRKTLFALLSEDKQQEVFAALANIVANASTQLPVELRSCLVTLDVPSTAIVPILYNLRNVVTSHALKSQQAKRAKGPSAGSDEEAWSKAMAILVEILESLLSHKAKVSSELLSELFENLRLGTELLLSNQACGEYLMQISMSNLSSSLKLLQVSGSNKTTPTEIISSLRVDTVINVIKTPCKPQTFQHALLLLSTLGSIAPDIVLHNAMPVFTFVGSTMLQRDDDYSFVVIEKTLQSILPPVMKDIDTKSKGKGSLARLQSSSNLLCVFTDAAKHVPRHRRVTFFSTLIQVMGFDYLAPICMLLIDRYSSKVAKQQDNINDIQTTLQLPLSLFAKGGMEGENAMEQWKALNEVWEESHRNWSHRKEDPVELQENVFLDCIGGVGVEHEGRRLDPIKRIIALLRFIHLAVVTNSDTLEVQTDPAEGGENNSEQRRLMWNFIEHALMMSQVENETVSMVARDTLQEMMKLAPVSILFEVTSALLNSQKVADQRNGLHLCNKSISAMSDEDREKSSTFTPKVIELCYSLMRKGTELAEAPLITLQAIAQDCTSLEHSALSAGLPLVIAMARQDTTTQRKESLDLLLTLSKHLGTRLIPQLSGLVSLSFDLLSDERVDRNIKVSALDLLASLIRSIPVFAASHVDAIIKLYIQYPSLQDISQSKTLLSAIVRYIAPSQLLVTIFTVWEQGDKGTLTLHTTCLILLERTIKSADKKSVMNSYKAIFKYLASVFDARRLNLVESAAVGWKLSLADLIIVEDKAVSVFLKLVLKLNESTFRPLFLRICDWAMVDLVDEEEEEEDANGRNGSNGQEIISRKVVLFKVMNALLTQLGELVSNYYLNVLDGVVEILQDFQSCNLQSEVLWKQVLLSLEKSASADKGRGSFWNENRFKVVVPSLVGQVNTLIVKNSTASESLLGDTVAALCQTVPDEACLKMVNNQLLSSTRSSQVKVKVTSIRVLEKVWRSKECEDTLLGLVPETVPSIAELLQESEIAIQEELGSFVAAVESVLGEGLDGYLQ